MMKPLGTLRSLETHLLLGAEIPGINTVDSLAFSIIVKIYESRKELVIAGQRIQFLEMKYLDDFYLLLRDYFDKCLLIEILGGGGTERRKYKAHNYFRMS